MDAGEHDCDDREHEGVCQPRDTKPNDERRRTTCVIGRNSSWIPLHAFSVRKGRQETKTLIPTRSRWSTQPANHQVGEAAEPLPMCGGDQPIRRDDACR